MINDGGVAMIVTTAERAKDLKKHPVHIAASAGSGDLGPFYTKQDFFREASVDVAARLRAQSGIGPSDVD
ncbi:beta-ketoacyl-[acyl-carrier-protein] synthase family protein, partial [Leucobacter celer]